MKFFAETGHQTSKLVGKFRWHNPHEEVIVLRRSVYGFQVCLVDYYHPPNPDNLGALSDFFEQSTDSNLILLGDFNFPEIQWKPDEPVVLSSGRGLAEKFLSFTSQKDLEQRVKVPTHSKGNILDLLFSNFDHFPVLKDGDAGLSDHTALTIDFPGLLSTANVFRSKRRIVHSMNIYSGLGIPVLLITCG